VVHVGDELVVGDDAVVRQVEEDDVPVAHAA